MAPPSQELEPPINPERFTFFCGFNVNNPASQSLVDIPPTLMAGIYGMNFKNMPEYDWAWGYQYGWAVIVLSALIPLVWFKVKGWF